MTVEPYALTTDSLETPYGVTAEHPLFAWKLRTTRRGPQPLAHRVRVYRDERRASGELLWDSGWLELDDEAPTAVAYGGRPLESLTRYSWDVSVRSADSSSSVLGSWFETGIRHDDEWSAEWIRRDLSFDPGRVPPALDDGLTDRIRMLQPPARFRREFEVAPDLVRARLLYTARGVAEVTINGRRVDATQFSPGWTEYRSRLQYRVVAVDDLVGSGPNAIGATVADGWWSGMLGFDPRHQGAHYGERPEFFAQLVLDFADGTRRVVGTDATWRELRGPLRHSDMMMGEWFDARQITPGWNQPGFDDATWNPVETVARGEERLVAETDAPIEVVGEVAPISVEDHGDGRTIIDFGQNLVGRLRLRLRGTTCGGRIVLRHAEALEADGGLYTENLRSAAATDAYIMAGDAEETYEPSFTFHGFRFAEVVVTGAPGVEVEAVAHVIHNAFDWTGAFECSDPMVNRIDANVRWGLKGNFLSIPTDCPQRDERMGWLADAQVFTPTALLHADVAPFYERWMRDVQIAQRPDGAYYNFVPVIQPNQREAAPGWGDGAVIVPWEVYRTTGRTRALEENFAGMLAWVDRIALLNPDRVWRVGVGNDYGDWLQIDADTPRRVVSTAYFARSSWIVWQSALVLGHERAAELGERWEEVRRAFAAEFIDEAGRVQGETQTGYLMALAWDLMPEHLVAPAVDALVRDIRSRGDRLTTGFLGVSLLCPTLHRFGHGDLAYRLVTQTEYPSWGYSVLQGATTIWERWDGWTEEQGFQTAGMNSFNHYSLGSVGEWLYRGVAGIDQEPDSAGYARLLIQPVVDAGPAWAKASFDSVRGAVRSEWRRDGDRVELTVAIPPRSTARIVLPGIADGTTEGGRPVSEAAGVEVLATGGADHGLLELVVGPGEYAFAVPLVSVGAPLPESAAQRA